MEELRLSMRINHLLESHYKWYWLICKQPWNAVPGRYCVCRSETTLEAIDKMGGGSLPPLPSFLLHYTHPDTIAISRISDLMRSSVFFLWVFWLQSLDLPPRREAATLPVCKFPSYPTQEP